MNNPSDPIIRKDIMRQWAEEQLVGDRNEGESQRERSVGRNREVVVDVFKRNLGPEKGTYYLRVSLRCPIKPEIITRYEIDLDRYNSEAEFLRMVRIGGAAVAEAGNVNRGANWDCEYVGGQAVEAAKELFSDINQQG
jgi:hypothetical protein